MCDKKWGYRANRMSQTAARMVTRSGGTEQTECHRLQPEWRFWDKRKEGGGKKFILMTMNTVKVEITHSDLQWRLPHTFLHVPHCPAHNFLPIPQWPHFPDGPLTSLAQPSFPATLTRIPLMKIPNDSYITIFSWFINWKMERHVTIAHKIKQIAHTYFPGNTKLRTRGCMCWVILYSGKYPLSYGVPVWERYGSTLLPATREQHDQNCTQIH